MDREKFSKIEEIILYLMGLSLFLDFKYSKILVPVVIVDLIYRKIVFKEKLNCGNENIKKFIIWFVVIGVFWNFLGGMSYKPARNFLKISRYIPFLFFLYPIFQEKKECLNKFLACSLISYIILLFKIMKEFDYMKPGIRVSGFEGISTTGDIGAIVALFSFGIFLKEEKYLRKIIYFLIFLSGIFITIATQGRAPLLSIGVGSAILLFLEILSKLNIKKILLMILLLSSILLISIKIIPKNYSNRFKTTFNTEKTVNNASNGLRIEMWKIGLKRIKENPILGSGTKYDKENLFRKFSEELPENTEAEKNYKYQLLNYGFNDAHSMYINAVVDNGVYVLALFIIWFGIPIYLLFKHKEALLDKYFLGSLGGLSAILIIGAFWMLWRTPEQMYFWILYSIMLSSAYKKEKKEEQRIV